MNRKGWRVDVIYLFWHHHRDIRAYRFSFRREVGHPPCDSFPVMFPADEKGQLTLSAINKQFHRCVFLSLVVECEAKTARKQSNGNFSRVFCEFVNFSRVPARAAICLPRFSRGRFQHVCSRSNVQQCLLSRFSRGHFIFRWVTPLADDSSLRNILSGLVFLSHFFPFVKEKVGILF